MFNETIEITVDDDEEDFLRAELWSVDERLNSELLFDTICTGFYT